MKLQNTTVSSNDKITLVSNLSTMLTAGIPILETVESLLDGAKGGQKKVLETMKEDLGQGKRIYTTFAKFPRIFDKVTVNIIKASEEAGTLDETLKDLILTIRKEMEFNDRIKSALIYPVFILVVFLGVMLMILVVVVPKISSVFLRMRVELPMPTKIMMFLSDALLKNTIPVVAGSILIGVAVFFLFKRFKREVVNLMISLPLISKLAIQIDLARFTRSLHLLLSSGIPITAALELTEAVVVKKEVEKAIKHTTETVNSGKKFSEGLKDNKHIFPSMIIKISEAGERTGSLDKSMQDASEYLDYQVGNTLKLVTALIEPLMLVGVGIGIGGMMMAIIAPIYGLIGQVGNR